MTKTKTQIIVMTKCQIITMSIKIFITFVLSWYSNPFYTQFIRILIHLMRLSYFTFYMFIMQFSHSVLTIFKSLLIGNTQSFMSFVIHPNFLI